MFSHLGEERFKQCLNQKLNESIKPGISFAVYHRELQSYSVHVHILLIVTTFTDPELHTSIMRDSHDMLGIRSNI